ncbi:MAG: restriction endonuclease subunit S, partial [Sphingomonadaceae bacterium]|nr:restriction endonuclease subunit S [Sphingomonadaceae bacterium]
TPGFLHHYLQSEEGLDQIGRASPGSADRNRTFAQKRMEAITVPVPALDAQRWFDRLQDRARAARAAQTQAATHLDRLLPAMLHEAFGE